jgi:hypothetical protein
MSQLDQQDAQSAAGTQDEDPFPRPDGRHLDQAHGGPAVMQERGRHGRPQRLRYGDDAAGLDRSPLEVAAFRRVGDNPAAKPLRIHALPDRGDLTGHSSRRPLAMWGYAGMAVFILVAAAGVGFLTGVPKTVLVMVGFSFFITSFAIGVGGTGWLIQGEVFPTAVRGRAAAIGASVDWIANFALIEVFPAWHNAIGLGWVMVCFAVIAVLAIGFVYRWLPETKGLSVEEAVSVFERLADAKQAAA